MTRKTKHPTKWWGAFAFTAIIIASWALAAPQAQAIQSVDELTVVDATGKKVGKLIDTGAEKDFVDVVLQAGTTTFVKLTVLRDGLGSSIDVAFASTDCSGTAYFVQDDSVDSGGHSLFAAAGVAPPGHTLYVEDTGATARTVTVGSFFSSDVGCYPGGFAVDAVPGPSMVDLDALFTPPFHLVAGSQGQVSGCCGDCNSDGAVTINEIITSVNYALGQCPAQ